MALITTLGFTCDMEITGEVVNCIAIFQQVREGYDRTILWRAERRLPATIRN
ncbi:hypothetical protein [Pectobacterium aroidearum]|uniref:hypothetical protein n=1 Tax=Pectobacterium aroidearum TaxID=1201031 RepID=UPI00261C21DB|nr:hypothetical protein [Pectobacterium aroidearum]WKA64409.1 hypothetical protein QX495_09950 [Pectobacterium aroidearum]